LTSLQINTTVRGRGANENLNGLIRQYIPKSTSFEEITIERIIEIQEKLNNRPRKRFNETPNYMFKSKKVAFCNLNQHSKSLKNKSANKTITFL
jgi:IS30 family transposase